MTLSRCAVLLLLLLPSLAGARADPAKAASASCTSLRHLTLPATAIRLPTHGARVRSATLSTSGTMHFCKVLGEIASVDPAAQPIRFEVNLPESWNSKAVHFGGGGFDGALKVADGLGWPVVSNHAEPTPLQRGYATFGSDSGHHHHYLLLPDIYNEIKARFALNDEQRLNYGHDALKKTHDAAVAIMQARYDRKPGRMFFLGGSTGGREAYFVTQRWPLDYDGVLGAYAGWNQVQLDLKFIAVTQAEYRKGDKLTRGWLPKTKTKLVAARVMEACDALDGVRDGLISDPAGCSFDLRTLSCPPGKDAKACLTPGQLQTFEAFAAEQHTVAPLEHGVQSIPGFNVTRGSDLTGSMGLLSHPLRQPAYPFGSFYYQVGSGVLRFFLTRDPHFDLFTFDPTTGGKYAGQLLPQSIASDASDADLAPFAGHGGKFLMVHGTTDATIPTGASTEFYEMLRARMGPAAVDDFVRFYLIPGFGHGRGVFNAGFDALGVLDAWIDTGKAPTGLVAVDTNTPSGGRTRPLCAYPAWPKYVSGDSNMASSFTCVADAKAPAAAL